MWPNQPNFLVDQRPAMSEFSKDLYYLIGHGGLYDTEKETRPLLTLNSLTLLMRRR